MAFQTFQPLIGDGNIVEAKVKWFNAGKGFGFVGLEDGSEAFLHISAVQAAGLAAPGEGATVRCEIGQGKKGPQVTRVIEIAAVARQQSAASNTHTQYISQERPAGTIDVDGAVKWFSVERGYGFVTPDDGGDPVFVGRDYVQRAGLQSLLAEQRVSMSVATTPKGREVRRIQVLETVEAPAALEAEPSAS